MRVLVTRPVEDAERTAAELEARGHQAVIAPLLEIRFREGPQIVLDGVQAILATSANGIRALARRTARRDLPVFAVGPQTAKAARTLGFIAVRSADGDAARLAEAVAAWARPAAGALYHPSGAQTRGGLAERLMSAGFTVRSEALYEALLPEALPPTAAVALERGELEAVLLYSPRSARIFARLVGAAGLGRACGRLAALCISQAAADGLAPLEFRTVAVAARPDQHHLLALLR